MIEVINLSKKFGDIFALRDVSFTVNEGDILGFLGPNGAGKTTAMRILCGFIPPTSGTAKVGGYDVLENPLAVKRIIGYLPERPPLYDEMTVDKYLHFVAELKDIPKHRIEIMKEKLPKE